jgi:hypothetical protein
MKPPGKRFERRSWADRLAPLILILLTLGLAATLVITALSLLGLTPSF